MPFSLEQEKVECVALVEKHLMSPPEFETRGILRYSKAKKIQQLEETKPFHSRLWKLRIEIFLPETRVLKCFITTAGELLLLKSSHTLRLHCSGWGERVKNRNKIKKGKTINAKDMTLRDKDLPLPFVPILILSLWHLNKKIGHQVKSYRSIQCPVRNVWLFHSKSVIFKNFFSWKRILLLLLSLSSLQPLPVSFLQLLFPFLTFKLKTFLPLTLFVTHIV